MNYSFAKFQWNKADEIPNTTEDPNATVMPNLLATDYILRFWIRPIPAIRYALIGK